ncbi:MAG: DNA-directed RNA polymerase subunit alpha C-terminal domain-containing protein [Brevefilum sp.]
MKKIKNFGIVLTLIIILSLIFPIAVSAAPIEDDRTVFGSNYTLESGRILDGNFTVIGGVVDIEKDAAVNGDMFVLGGLVSIDGTVRGNLTVVGGTVTLEDNAVIEGDLISPASYINRRQGAVVEGNQVEGLNIPWTEIELPMFHRSGPLPMRGIRIVPIITHLARAAVFTLVLLGLAALMLLVMPEATETMTHALSVKPWGVLGFGALTAFVMIFGGIILTITICFIPLVILAGLVVALAVLAGWLALGYKLGKRVASGIFKTEWHPVLAAILGNLVLYLLAMGLGLIPCLGGFLVFVAMLFALGMSVVTLFGGKPYPRIPQEPVEAEKVILKTGEEAKKADGLLVEEVKSEPTVIEHPIEDLDLGTRSTNILKSAGLNTVEDVLSRLGKGDDSLLSIDGFGPKSLSDLKQALRENGYQIL